MTMREETAQSRASLCPGLYPIGSDALRCSLGLLAYKTENDHDPNFNADFTMENCNTPSKEDLADSVKQKLASLKMKEVTAGLHAERITGRLPLQNGDITKSGSKRERVESRTISLKHIIIIIQQGVTWCLLF